MLESKEDKNNLISNFFSLSMLQGANMILPLITLPYLVRVLGVENFGLVNFSLSIIMFFNILISFGFELSATREISVNRNNINIVSEIFSSVLIIKLFLLLLSLVILSILVVTVDKINQNAILYYVTFGLVIGNSLFSSWFFQGMEKMKYITYINVSVKVFFTLLVFLLVKDEADFIYVAALTSLGAIVGGIYSLWLVIYKFRVNIKVQNASLILRQVKSSYHFFLSGAANKGYRYYIITLIGISFENIAVGYYVMAEKLLYAFLSLSSIVSQTLYPYMTRTKNLKLFIKVFFFVLVTAIIILIPTMYFNEILLKLIFDIENEMLSKIFLIIFSGAIFGTISALIGYPVLAALGHAKEANNSLIIASALSTLYITIVTLFFKNIFLVSMSAVVFPLILMIIRIYYIHKTKIFSNTDSRC
ncbi:MAG: oligosaccharide flippase family protein [Cocleimonas sp.]